MLFECAKSLQGNISFLSIFNYVSVRAAAALLTALLSSIACGDWWITVARILFRSKGRQHVPDAHRAKDGLPTMGGIFIVGNVMISMLLWCNIYDPYTWIVMLCLVLFGAIGLWDDWAKLVSHAGISEREKFIAQAVAALAVVGSWWYCCIPEPTILIPVLKHWQIALSAPLFIGWALFIVVGASNAVNLTDGLDGLAIGSLIQNFATFAIIAYCAGHAVFARYLHIPYVATSELVIICAALVGASLGFLWFNTYPAQIFMGDVGSLSLGAALGLLALMVRQELLLAVAGVLFVVEALSVILQVGYFRCYRKRLFRMAPIHHHFELLGWPEAKIVTRFGIITSIACLCALLMLKVR